MSNRFWPPVSIKRQKTCDFCSCMFLLLSIFEINTVTKNVGFHTCIYCIYTFTFCINNCEYVNIVQRCSLLCLLYFTYILGWLYENPQIWFQHHFQHSTEVSKSLNLISSDKFPWHSIELVRKILSLLCSYIYPKRDDKLLIEQLDNLYNFLSTL